MKTRTTIIVMIFASTLFLWLGCLLNRSLYFPEDVLVYVTLISLMVIVFLIKLKYFKIIKWIIIVFLIFLILTYGIISVVIGIEFENQTDKRLYVSCSNALSLRSRRYQVKPKNKLRVTLWRGDDSEDFLSELFFIVVTDTDKNIYYQQIITGENLPSEPVILD